MKKIIILLVIIAAVLAGVWWFGQADSRVSLIKVDQAAVEQQDLTQSILASGNLVFADERAIRSQINASVLDVLIEEGEQVEQKQLLVRLDPEDYQATVSAQEARVAQQQLSLDRARLQQAQLNDQLARQRELASRQVVGRDSVLQLEQQQALAQIDIRQLEQQLRQTQVDFERAKEMLVRTEIRSPIQGIVSKLDIKTGEIALSGAGSAPVLFVANPDLVWAEVEIDEAEIGRVGLGQSVKVYAVAYPDQAMVGEVAHIATSARATANRRSLTFTVRVRVIETDDLPVKPGMSARVEIITNELADAIAVPVVAVQKHKDENGYFVWLVDEQNQLQQQSVELGIADLDHQQIVTGLAIGQTVVVGPATQLSRLESGQTVELNK